MAHAHIQLHNFHSNIIWIMSNEIIPLLISFNLIPTSFRYCINYLRNPNLNMGKMSAIYISLIFINIERIMIETYVWYLSLYISGQQSQLTIYQCNISPNKSKWRLFSKMAPNISYIFMIFDRKIIKT
jgi:hypothetical protein